MKRTALTSEDGPMMSSVAVGYSKNQIDRAGEALRAYQLGVRPLNANELVLRLGIVEEFVRRTHHRLRARPPRLHRRWRRSRGD
jgi:hypothetical protein